MSLLSANPDETVYSKIELRRQNNLSGVSRGSQKIGIDYIPNMNTKLRVIAPFQSDQVHKSLLASVGLPTASDLPEYFNWADGSNVRKHRMSDFKDSWIMKPPNQATCGSCWAVSSTSVLSDRWAIKNKKKNPVLAAAVTASCANRTGDGCQGGYPADAGCFFAYQGVPQDSCVPYSQKCSPTSSVNCTMSGCCGGGGGGGPQPYARSGEIVDTCNQQVISTGCHKCTNGKKPKSLFFAKKKSVVSLGAGSQEAIIQRIKENLFAGGPVVAAYKVYADFMTPNKWPGGIYINDRNSPAGQHMAGGHAVTIVGWGKGNAGSFGVVPYWIVRNSWGTSWNSGNKSDGWNKGGFFKIAMTNQSKNINTDVLFDVPGHFGGGLFGGVTSFQVGDTEGTPSLEYHPLDSGTITKTSSKRKGLWLGLTITASVLLLIVLLVVIISVYRKSRVSNLF